MEATPTGGPTAGGAVFRDLRVADLVYRLCRGAVDLRPLTVLGRRRVALGPGLEATLFVLGASHAVELRWGDECATEILACSAAPPGATVAAEFAAGAAVAGARGGDGGGAAGGDVERRFDLPGLSLEVRLRVVRDDEAQRDRLRRLLTAPDFASRGLAVRFPAGQGAAGGLTLLRADPDAPRIETVHSYPAEGTLVLTETRCVR